MYHPQKGVNNLLWNFARIRITGANTSGVVDDLCKNGVVLEGVRAEDELSVCATIRSRDLTKLKGRVERQNHSVSVVGTGGIYQLTTEVVKRPILLFAICLIVFLSFWVPTRVFFIGVTGNGNILTWRILQEAESCGICFGAKRSYVRSEVVKNNLLESIPGLQWVGVNTKGCTAVISVREDLSEKSNTENVGYSNIVAERDGIVLYTSVTAGSPGCSVGDAVQEGQVLISGWQDMGLLVKTTRASGEIFALTEREIEMITPISMTEKGEIVADQTKYSLLVGKKRINLSKGSGISYTGCDKIYENYYLTFPGGFVLPLAMETERTVVHKTLDYSQDKASVQNLLSEQIDRYLLDQTVSGTIQGRFLQFEDEISLGRLVARYNCVEMIGRERIGEMNIQYGENH